MTIIKDLIAGNGLVFAFLVVCLLCLAADFLSKRLAKGRIHPTAIAILLGLGLAYAGGRLAGGSKGIADVALFSGMGLFGGAMFRDFAIVSTAYGVKVAELKRCGKAGVISLVVGILLSFAMGVLMGLAGGYRTAVDLATLGAGAVTFVVGPVTGSALGASSDVVAISIGVGIVKSVAVMILTPLFAKHVHLDTPQAAMIYGGLMGTTSGTSAGMAAVDPQLVPYAAMTATFYTGLGCLLCPSVLYFLVEALF